jgi:hypothetical protein
MSRATDLIYTLPDYQAFIIGRRCDPRELLRDQARHDVGDIVRAELGDVLEWLKASEQKGKL